MKNVFAALCLITCAFGTELPAQADTVKAYCSYSTSSVRVTGDCKFSQYSGTIVVDFDDTTHIYNANRSGTDYTRSNRDGGIWLKTDDSTLVVLWQKPEINCEGSTN